MNWQTNLKMFRLDFFQKTHLHRAESPREDPPSRDRVARISSVACPMWGRACAHESQGSSFRRSGVEPKRLSCREAPGRGRPC